MEFVIYMYLILKMSQQQLVNKLCCGFNWWCKFSSERHVSFIKLDLNSFMYYLYLYYIVIHIYVCITITVHNFVFIESNLASKYLLASKNNRDLQRSRSRTSQQYLTSGKQTSITKLTDGNEIIMTKCHGTACLSSFVYCVKVYTLWSYELIKRTLMQLDLHIMENDLGSSKFAIRSRSPQVCNHSLCVLGGSCSSQDQKRSKIFENDIVWR